MRSSQTSAYCSRVRCGGKTLESTGKGLRYPSFPIHVYLCANNQGTINVAHTSDTNTRVALIVVVAYGDRLEMLQAAKVCQYGNSTESLDALDETSLGPLPSTEYAPEMDPVIQTGGKLRCGYFILFRGAPTEPRFTGVDGFAFVVYERGAE